MLVKNIDSRTVLLNLVNHKWVKLRKTKANVKLHLRLVFMGKGTSYPEKAVLTIAKEHDCNRLKVLVDDKECMYVLNHNYIDYERFDCMMDDSYFFSRLCKNIVNGKVKLFNLTEYLLVLKGQTVLIGSTQKRAENAFRLLVVRGAKGNKLKLITNCFDLSSEEISEMYQSRWTIELFFKWIKQHLNIKKFYVQSEMAVDNSDVHCTHLNVLVQIEMNSNRKILQSFGLMRGFLKSMTSLL